MSENVEFILTTEEEIDGLAAKIMAMFEHQIVLFIGDLGAGKTTLVKAMLRQINPDEKTSSPSYSIINEYADQEGQAIYHIDLYRLDNIEEAYNLGIEEYLYSGRLCLIEWPQIIEDLLDSNYHLIKIEIMENNQRRITFS